jgi:anti-anti-sigma regulatory factor
MEAAAQSAPPSAPPTADGGAGPKLAIDKVADGGIACLKFTGSVDESFDGKKLAATVKCDTLVLDLGGVKKISSFGIREWVDFVMAVAKQAPKIVLIECAPKVVDQLNMVGNFAGGGRVYSFYAPFRCDYCDSEHKVLLTVDKDAEAIKSMKLAERPCPSCKESMYFDEDGTTFFSYLAGQEKFELDADVAGFLSSKLNYSVSDAARKLRIDKMIEGRAVYLRLAGDLDNTFPREKLAEGLEGNVVIDVAGIGKIEPAGAAEWRGFIQMVTPGAEHVYLVGVPPQFLEKLSGRDDLGAKGQILSFSLPYTCKTCGTTGGQLIDVEEHHEVLKFATAPELRCTHCKNPMACAATEGLMTILPGLPKPAVGSELRKIIKELRERKIEKKKAGGPTTVAEAAQQRGGGMLVPFAAALLAVVVAGGGFFAYKAITTKSRGTGLGKVMAKSAEQRPKWLVGDAPGGSYCNDTADKGLSCVGVSSIAASQDDADEEARDAALDAIAGGVAVKIEDPKWRQAVLTIYKTTREAKLGAFDKDPSNTQARRDVREARKAVGNILRATNGGAVPPAPTGRYWEEYDTADGKRFVAFSEFAISGAEAKRMVDGYTKSASALGATVVSIFPQVGWRYPRVESGAIVVALDKGPLKELGLAEQYLILGVAGRDVVDAATFAKLATDEHTQLKDRGGTFALKVQAGDSAPREFATPIKGKVVETPLAHPTGNNGNSGNNGNPTMPTGGVNVWDKFGGGKGGGRDDPSQ